MQANPNANSNSSPSQQAVAPSASKETNQRATTQQPTKEPSHPTLSIGDSLTIGFTGVIALMAIAQFIVFRRQWKVMASQLKTMDGQLAEMKTTTQELDKLVVQATENARSGQLSAEAAKANSAALVNIERAWLLATVAECSPHGRPEEYEGYFAVRNFGRSPAWVLGAGGIFAALESAADLSKEPTYKATKNSAKTGAALGPGQECRFVVEHLKTKLIPSQEFDRVNMNQLLWFLYGFVTYRDIFGEIRTTKFCWRYDPVQRVFAPTEAPSGYNGHT